MGNMIDTDAMVLSEDPDTMTLLACHLNWAMEHDATARARYAAIYGVEWSPLGDGLALPDCFGTGSERIIAVHAITPVTGGM